MAVPVETSPTTTMQAAGLALALATPPAGDAKRCTARRPAGQSTSGRAFKRRREATVPELNPRRIQGPTRPPYHCPLPQLLPGRGRHTIQLVNCLYAPPLAINEWDHLFFFIFYFFLKNKWGSPATAPRHRSGPRPATRSTGQYGCIISASCRFI